MRSLEDITGSLAHIRILDLADNTAGFCSRLLADLGAQVIRIEHSDEKGAAASTPSTPFKQDLFDLYYNSGKDRINLDLKSKKGQDVFLRLLKKADMLVETFPPGYLHQIDLGIDSLIRINPHLIVASVTGFGQLGPNHNHRSCDLVAAACGGQMYVTGTPNNRPLILPGGQSGVAASLFSATGLLLALKNRLQTGKGGHVDISVQEAVVSTLEHVLVRYFSEGTIPERSGALHWDRTFMVLPCKDGYFHLTLFQQWETLIEWMDSEGMAQDLTDPQWKDEAYRKARVTHVIKVIGQWTKTHRVHELFELGQLMRFPWAPVQSPSDLLRCPQLEARNFYHHINLQMGDPVKMPGLPFLTSRNDNSSGRPVAPRHQWNAEHVAKNCNHNALHFKKAKKHKQSKYLNKLRILDLTRVVAGPYATRILADHGAEVIKIQTRITATGAESNTTPYFNAWNRNKRSITLDLNQAEARKLFLRLVRISDVVVENYSTRVMPNWGLDYNCLKRENNALIMLSMSGMGQTGPYKDFVAFGPTLQSLGGLTHLTGYSENEPLGPGFAYSDIISGLYGVIGVLAALEYREITGKGQLIDLSEYEAVCTTLGPTIMAASLGQQNGSTTTDFHLDDTSAPYGCYRCRGEDRWCVIAVFTEEDWNAFCKATENPGWEKDNRFNTNSRRCRYRKELDRLIEQWTSNRTAEEVVKRLQEGGIAAGIVKNAADLAADPQLLSRDFFTIMNHPILGNLKTERSTVFLPAGSREPDTVAPSLGEANHYVFGELLGLSENTINAYIEKEIIS